MYKRDFNEDWTVRHMSVDMAEDFIGSNAEIRQVTLPHDAMIREQRRADNPSGSAGGFFAGGDYEYCKSFDLEEIEKDSIFVIEFEGIYNRGYVYVNEEFAGCVHYGYTGLFLDITPHLHFGEKNTIRVKAVNSDVPNSRWYTGSGIYRPVYLYKGNKIHVDANGLKISAPEISGESAKVLADIVIDHSGINRKTVSVKSVITNNLGKTVEKESVITLEKNGSTVLRENIFITEPALWSVDSPELYTYHVEIWDEGELLDEAESTFGIRKLECNPLEGLKINGEKVLLRGGCIHHDNGPVGAAAFARAEERRIELLKAAGFNSVRISHNSASKALLDACDRNGMLVMDESFDMWTQSKSQYDYSLDFADHWETDVEDIVRKDFNHPSVIMYSIGNEIKEIGTVPGAEWSRKIADKFRELDSTRYVTNAINGMFTILQDLPRVMIDLGMITAEQAAAAFSPEQNSDAGEGNINDFMTAMVGALNDLSAHPLVEERLKESYNAIDIIGLNYMRGVYREMGKNPNRVFLGSETFPTDIDLNWKLVKEIPSCIGDYTWTAWDYLGEAGIGIAEYNKTPSFSQGYPAYIAYCGDLDITGYRRPASYFREIVFGLRKEPYIAVQLPEHYGDMPTCSPWTKAETLSGWTWKGYEGKGCKVEVYSDAPVVELFINGKSVGTGNAGEENRYCAVFDTVYEPGEISAVAKYADGHTSKYTLETADEQIMLDVQADREEIDVNDLSYITIELKDSKGVLHTCEDRCVKLTIEGDGIIQGFGSADPKSEENFYDEKRRTYQGRALAVIRASRKGLIRATVSSEGLESVDVTITVK